MTEPRDVLATQDAVEVLAEALAGSGLAYAYGDQTARRILAALPEGWHLRRVPDTAQAAVVGHAEWNHPGCAACDKARALHDRLQSRGGTE